MKPLPAAKKTKAEINHKIVEAVGAVAKESGVSLAAVALAWLRSKSVVAALIVARSRRWPSP